jgi:hypothetical protein
MIKAIETAYKGYRFRSRLEARWAVFFDALGIEWQYEPEGFELPSGRYLPDFAFRRPIDGVERVDYTEIKGAPPTRVDLVLAGELARAAGTIVEVFQGAPGDNNCTVWRFFSEIQPTGPHVVGLDFLEFKAWSHTGFEKHFSLREMQAAVDAARGARFEHGESGAWIR